MLNENYMWLWIILFGLSIFQWLLIIPAALTKNVVFGRSDNKNPRIEILFFDDIYFFYWNIICTFYIAVYLFILYSASDWIAAFELSHNLAAGTIIEKHNQNPFLFLERMYIVSIIAVGIAVYAVCLQWNKISKLYCSDNECTYWWCAQSCKFCYYVRLVFLFSNVFGFVLVTWKLLVISISIGILMFKLDLNADIFSPDKMAGFKSLGNFITLISVTFLLGFVLGVAGHIDHNRKQLVDHNRKQFGGKYYLFADLYHTFCIFYALAVAVVPSVYFYRIISQAKLNANLPPLDNNEFYNLGSLGEKLAWYNEQSVHLLLLEKIEQTSPFLISSKNYGLTVLLYMVPLIIFSFKHLLQKRQDNYHTHEKEGGSRPVQGD